MDTICITGKRPGSNAALQADVNVIDGRTSTGAWTQALPQVWAWSTRLANTVSLNQKWEKRKKRV